MSDYRSIHRPTEVQGVSEGHTGRGLEARTSVPRPPLRVAELSFPKAYAALPEAPVWQLAPLADAHVHF